MAKKKAQNLERVSGQTRGGPGPQSMQLPTVTHQQFLIIDLLMDDEHSGRFIRDRLLELMIKKSLPAFYQLMGRLEESGLIAGIYKVKNVAGQVLKERWYSVTDKGSEQWHEIITFYTERKRRQVDSAEHDSEESGTREINTESPSERLPLD